MSKLPGLKSLAAGFCCSCWVSRDVRLVHSADVYGTHISPHKESSILHNMQQLYTWVIVARVHEQRRSGVKMGRGSSGRQEGLYAPQQVSFTDSCQKLEGYTNEWGPWFHPWFLAADVQRREANPHTFPTSNGTSPLERGQEDISGMKELGVLVADHSTQSVFNWLKQCSLSM